MIGNFKTVGIVSGGLDSVVMAHHLAQSDHDLHLVSVDYGQRHSNEIEFAGRCANRLGVRHSVIDLTSITKLISTSSLTGDLEVPDGDYNQNSMMEIVVPNRNMILIAVAGAIAISEGSDYLALGVHGGDHYVYPDCRPEFVEACADTIKIGMSEVSPKFKGLLAPFVNRDKAWIVSLGATLNVPWEETWSCYRGGAVQCGRCGTCSEQQTFTLAGVSDPTEYLAS